jgi:hypothetical protein
VGEAAESESDYPPSGVGQGEACGERSRCPGVAVEGVGDVLMACGLVVPAAVAGTVSESDDVGELCCDQVASVRVGEAERIAHGAADVVVSRSSPGTNGQSQPMQTGGPVCSTTLAEL